jgi:hypothetical protein
LDRLPDINRVMLLTCEYISSAALITLEFDRSRLRSLRQHHLHKHGDHVDVRVFEISLLQRAQSFGSAGIAQHRIAGVQRGLQQVEPMLSRPPGLGKVAS